MLLYFLKENPRSYKFKNFFSKDNFKMIYNFYKEILLEKELPMFHSFKIYVFKSVIKTFY